MRPEEVRKNAHALEISKIFAGLETSKEGLAETEAKKRLERFGLNDIPERNGDRVFRILLKQFTSPLIFILIIAGAVSFLLREYIDSGVIFCAVILNAAIGFYQELKASNILEELKKVISYEARIVRDGKRKDIDSKNLVIGDIIYVQQGQRIPADARLLAVNEFKVNEAVFTGESMPVEKKAGVLDLDVPVADRLNMIFWGTHAEEGNAIAVVVATGVQTELGKITELVKEERAKDVTPLETKLGKLAKFLGVVFLLISAALFGIGVLTGVDVFSMFITAVAVAVAAIPEGLPVALGVILAIGAKRVLEKGGLVRKMVAAEALGNTTVIASDKTATLTEGKMTLSKIVDFDAVEYDISVASTKLLELLVLNTNAYIENPKASRKDWEIEGRPMDKAIVAAAQAIGLGREDLDEKYPRIAEIPFSARYKYSAVLNKFDGKKVVSVMGAPEVILAKSVLDKKTEQKVRHKLNELTSKGFRVLGLAAKETKKDNIKHGDLTKMEFLVYAVFSDPIRKDVKKAISVSKAAGLRTIIITGDHLLTAKYVARELGILKSDERAIEGKELGDEHSIAEKIDDYDVFARISPDEKVRIVKALGMRGERVAVIGDGVNDGPALLSADIGVAVGSGTDVAKEASDLILLNDSFSIIVEAIRQGRIILDNIKKVIIFLLSDAFTEIILIAGSIFAGFPLALLPAQILWVNLIEDGLPAVALAFERDEEREVMKRKPDRAAKIFGGDMKALIVMFTIVTDLVLFGLFWYFLKSTSNIDYARTMIFIALGLESLIYVYSVRSLSKPFWKLHIFSNHLLNFAVVAGLFLYLIAIYFEPLRTILNTVVLNARDWIIVFGFALFNVAVIEIGKKVFMRK